MTAKEAAAQVIERRLPELVSLSHFVHAHPELCFDETVSARAAAEALRAGGMEVTEGVYDLPTAFESRSGSGDLVIAVCAEYDALPGVGHACGHNIIAAAAVGAGLALAEVAGEVGLEVRVLGTPAEEGGGGKVMMLDRGAFEGVHAAMMIHPWPTERLTGACLAVSHFDVHFTGREAHASAAPWQGVNALDAMTIAQVALGLLRQQLPPGDQVHGVVTEGGGAANVIPASVTGRFMARSKTIEGLGALQPRLAACFEAGALATGCTVRYEELSPVYSHMEADPELLAAYRVNAQALGRTFEADDDGQPLPTFSTDMANVSLAVPTIHPLVGIETHGAVNHQHEFAAACVTPSADAAVRDGAIAMAWTAIDAATDPALRARLLAG
ncbi:MAG TPA: amidohydrolase [Acidimicrobiales bacterium]|jgi:amidohydrolase